jgi:outer membrane protein assembly factor BamD (BamD/ComL family)
MSISGIASTALSSLLTATQSAQNGQGNFQQIQSEFQQLGQDLQAGNLTQAQQDYATLSQNSPNAQSATTAATSSANSSQPIAQAFAALSQDLQNGNISRAQQAYATIQQDFQQQQQQGAGQVHHHHPQSRFRDIRQISRGKFDRLPRTTAGFTTSAFDGCGLRDPLLARPAP